jgi:hypothetical protein
MFAYKISLNRVHDRVRIKEGAEALDLRVDADAMRMVVGLNEAQQKLKSITDDSPPEAVQAAARCFAWAIFGDTQTERLMRFYRNDAACVINVCGRYFSDRLSKLIDKAQRRMK